MDYFSAILLGIVEGLTEFLPVSSTGHLILAGHMLGFDGPGSKVFEIVIQLGAILAIVVLYWKKFWSVAITLHSSRASQHFVRNIILAVLPSLLLGFVLYPFIKLHLFNLQVVAIALIVGGIAILIIERRAHRDDVTSTEAMGVKTALAIGLFQCLALIPGVSRSGATIMGARLCQVTRVAAAEFSFFLAVPTMIAAASYDLYKNWGLMSEGSVATIAVGFVTAFVVALLVVRWLVNFVQHHGFVPFAWYRIALGAAMLCWLSSV
jgi:undecaprenyl-diphosphatase